MDWEKRWFQYSILLILAFVWGSSFLLIKIGLKSFASDQAAAIRMLLASLFLLPLAIKNRKFLKKEDLIYLLIAGFIGSFIPAFLFTKAQTRIDSAIAGILNSLTPVFTLLIGMMLFGSKYKWKQISGLVLGLIGAVGLIAGGDDLSLGKFNTYGLYIVLATVFYGTNINIVKSKLTHLTGIQITSLSFVFISPVAFLYLMTTDFEPVVQNPQWPWHLGALAILGIIGTASAMLLMNSLIRYSTPVFASSVTYLIPIFAIMWGIIDGEAITWHHMGNMGIILLGVYLINRKGKKRLIGA